MFDLSRKIIHHSGFDIQVYLSLYATIGHIVDSVVSGTCIIGDSLSLSSLKVTFSSFTSELNLFISLCGKIAVIVIYVRLEVHFWF